ncbi:mucin-3A-like [Canis aureus]
MQGLCHCPLGFSGDHCELQEIRCQNGDKWDGLKCHCPSTIYGSRCEFAVEQVDLDTVDAEVGMEVSVDQEFSPDLNDNTSKAYKDFSDTFRDQMQKIYQNVQGFKDVEILSLRSGSIVVDYVVLLELPFSLQLESEYEKVKTVLKEELQNLSHKEDSSQNNQTICRCATAKGYEDFYFPVVEKNRLRCITKCASGVDGAIDCHQGRCLVQRRVPLAAASPRTRTGSRGALRGGRRPASAGGGPGGGRGCAAAAAAAPGVPERLRCALPERRPG